MDGSRERERGYILLAEKMDLVNAEYQSIGESKAVVIDLTAGEDEIAQAEARLVEQEQQIVERILQQDKEEKQIVDQEEVEEAKEFELGEQKMRLDHQEALDQARRAFEGQHIEAIRASNNPNHPQYGDAVRFLEEKKQEWEAIQLRANLTFQQRLQLRQQEFKEQIETKRLLWNQKMQKEIDRRTKIRDEWNQAKEQWTLQNQKKLAERKAALDELKRVEAERNIKNQELQARELQFKAQTQEQQRQLENKWTEEKNQRQAELARIDAQAKEAERKWRMAQADKKQEAEMALKFTAYFDDRDDRLFKRQEAALALRTKIELNRQQFEFDQQIRLAKQQQSRADAEQKQRLQEELARAKHAFEQQYKLTKLEHEQSLQALREEENRRRNRAIEEQKLRVLDMAQVDQRFKQELALQAQQLKVALEQEKQRLAQARFDAEQELKREKLRLEQKRVDMEQVTKQRELEYKQALDAAKLQLEEKNKRELRELNERIAKDKLELAKRTAETNQEAKRLANELALRIKQEEAKAKEINQRLALEMKHAEGMAKLELATRKAEEELKIKRAELEFKQAERKKKKGRLTLKRSTSDELGEDQAMDGGSLLGDANRDEVESLIGSDALSDRTSVDAKEFKALEDFYSSLNRHIYNNRRDLLDAQGKSFVRLTLGESVLNGSVKRTALQVIDTLVDYSKFIKYLGFARMVYDLDISTDKEQFVQTLVQLARTGLAPDLIRRVGLAVDQLDSSVVPSLIDIARSLSVARVSPDMVVGVARMLAENRLTLDNLLESKSMLEARSRQEREIKDLKGQLEEERKHSEMKDEYLQALDRLSEQDKQEANAAILLLRDKNFLSRITLFRDIAIWMSQQEAPIKTPEALWASIQQYSKLQTDLMLVQNQNNISADLRDLLRLLDDNLLQPKPTLQLLRSLLNNPRTSNLGSVADTIVRLERRNSDLSDSFRKTLVAMAAVLQVMQDVSKRYASQVLLYIQNLSNQMYQVIASWGLAPNNPLAVFVQDLTRRFVADNYSVEVKADGPQFGTLDLTFKVQGLDLSTDAVFLHTVSLLKWLDRFLVDPKRPSDPGMASLWSRASAGLDDWQQAVIDTFAKTDVTGPAQPVATITNGIFSASRNVSTVVEDSLRKVNSVTVDSLDRFSRDLKTQEDRLNRRVEYLLTKPALGQYVLTVNSGQDSKTEQKARDLFKAFIDATRVALLENKKDDANSVEVMAEINKLANEMDKLKFESNVKDSEYKRLESEHKKLETDFKTTDKAKRDAEKKISDAQRELTTPAAKALVGLQSDLVIDLKAVLKVYGDKLDELEQTSKVVTAMATKYGVALNRNAQASVLLFKDMDAVLDFFSKKYDDWKAASQTLVVLSNTTLFPGGHQPTQNLNQDVKDVLAEFRDKLNDWEETEKLVFAYANQKLRNVSPLQKALLKKNTETVLDAYEKYRADFVDLAKKENDWWDEVKDVRYPFGQIPETELEEFKQQTSDLAKLNNDIDRFIKRHSIVTGWVKALAKLTAENDLFTVKELINKAKGKGSSSAKSAAASKPSTSLNPYYRVQFNGEVDTLTGGEVFPVFLLSTPFMRLWLFAREFAGAASNQLGNILEPLAPGLEINDERTLFILRTYQNQNPGPKDSPDLPTGANRAELAKQQLADDEDKQNLKETAEERRKFQEKVALKYIKQLDDYKDLEQYEIKVRQYFKEMAMNALVHCQEILQRSDLPDFRRITLAELINSPHLSSGFARMCGLYLLVKQGTVPGMISTQSSAANRVAEFDQHARNLPRMYRRQGKYVWEVVRIPSSISDKTAIINKRIRL